MAFLLVSLKVFLISTCVLFTALALNISFPLITHFLATHVPLTWNFLLLCLKPPYLIFLLVIAITASSKFHHHYPTPLPFKPPPPPPLMVVEEEPPALEDLNLTSVDVKTSVVEETLLDSLWTQPEEEEFIETPPTPTMDDVWKMINKERSMELKKQETFKVKDWRNSIQMFGATSTRKEPLPSQQELDQRVEGFLKINYNMG
ncbi:hypothetical protein RIF29_35982 [Crotalaria pallida]|uniref:DUF4408 domain-containing protein n=1 Tax=Crotalaria pallida TaxID=3830 RepID=A0AAN9EAS7_CROPI